ncbi:hypothetical protein HHK36_032451 [Tetracentron sinense]|uniref:Amidase domain-containing protein n=1 Tax=Tetracentron sinense TaxID=13715 RepID=A0A834Y957_TETSI|nr:hypothetical protein HHK36_032451 [Tetracentron sinense]
MASDNPLSLTLLILSSSLLPLFISAGLCNSISISEQVFSIKEATINDIQLAFKENRVTSRQLVELYLQEIETLNHMLRAVIEVNPDALDQAHKADGERKSRSKKQGWLGGLHLHGIPVLLKDNIATKDKMNTTAGSFALLGSVVPRDAGVVKRLRRSGAVILGKASLSEWSHFRSPYIPHGWSARAGQGKNPYTLSGNPCGSSSGSAIAVAANMVTVSLGTETDGSIMCPASYNSVVGIKPTVGLTSRAGVVPISLRQDSIGPICRTVSDAVYVLDAITGFDPRDGEATREASKFIPVGGYTPFLIEEGLKRKRLGIVRNLNFDFVNGSISFHALEQHLITMRQKGAIIVDNLEIVDADIIRDPYRSGENTALVAEYKLYLDDYLKDLIKSPVRSIADIISFNEKNSELEMSNEFGQEILLEAEMTSGFGNEEKKALEALNRLSRNGFERLMKENKLDAMVTLGWTASPVLAIGGYPGINVPAGYDIDGKPFGICFGGLKGTEPKLIEIAYAFEQATMIRKLPHFESNIN